MPTPPKNLLDRYLHYTAHQVSPTIYHQWSFLAILGAAMERRCWLTRGYETLRIYPGQLMVVLVGKSALAKKSTAIRLAADLLGELPHWLFQRLPTKTSPQQLLSDVTRLDDDSLPLRYPEGHALAGRRVNSSGFIVADELAVFFSTDNFNETMASTINKLNDAESGKQTIKFRSWRAELWNPIIGLVGGITPSGIARELPKAARTAGFFGRILWIWAPGTDRGNPLTEKLPDMGVMRGELRAAVRKIADMYGPFQFTKQGKEWFEAWYWKYHQQLSRMDQLGMLDTSGYWGRKDGHLLRLGMTCSAARSSGRDRWLKAEDLQRAGGLLADMEKGLPDAMAEIGVGPHSEENTRILVFIEARGKKKEKAWVPQREIMKFGNALGMRKIGMEDCLARLGEAGEIVMRFKGGEKCWQRQLSQGNLMRRAVEERSEERMKEKSVESDDQAVTSVRAGLRLVKREES